MGSELAVPESRDIARSLPSDALYKLELAGQIASEILDERVIAWTEEGRTQEWIAGETGMGQSTVSDRQRRLGVEPKSKRGRPRREEIPEPGNSDGQDAEVVEPDEVLAPDVDVEAAEAAKRRLQISVAKLDGIAKALTGLPVEQAASACTTEELARAVDSYKTCEAAIREALKTLARCRKATRATERAEEESVRRAIAEGCRRLARRYPDLDLPDARRTVAHELNERDGLGYSKDLKTAAALKGRHRTVLAMEADGQPRNEPKRDDPKPRPVDPERVPPCSCFRPAAPTLDGRCSRCFGRVK